VVLLIQVFLDVMMVTGLTVPNVLKEHTSSSMLENSTPGTQFIPQDSSIHKSHVLILQLVIIMNKLLRFRHCWPVKHLTLVRVKKQLCWPNCLPHEP
jgi:hypothetical protein